LNRKKVGGGENFMKCLWLTLVTALTVVAIGSGVALSDPSGNSSVRTIQVSGGGEAHAAPDYATLNLAIETHAKTAAEAAERNAALAEKINQALVQKITGKGKVSTGGYSLYPEYNNAQANERPMIEGYQAQNSITVETGDLDMLGPLIDTAIAAGANRVNSLDFSLHDNTKARNNAIANASKDAQAQAEALAASLKVKLGPIISASTESESRPVPVMAMARFSGAAMNSAPTPVNPGDVSVPATVSLTYAIE
jgi:uncharacterized protein